ncbi:type II secretion system protein, partial [bacterium]|nr:type II secretion system protein [bacterium]
YRHLEPAGRKISMSSKSCKVLRFFGLRPQNDRGKYYSSPEGEVRWGASRRGKKAAFTPRNDGEINNRKELINSSTYQLIHFKKSAFTLAEVLITLGIIGVVSAMTIPTLMTKIQEKTTYNKLKATYAILNQAHKLAVAENGSAEGWDIGTADSASGARKLYEIYKPHLKLARECGTSHGCFYEGTYKALFNNSYYVQPSANSTYARGQLLNGASVAFWSNGSGCEGSDNWCGTIFVDINGADSPNKAGVDYFRFVIGGENIRLPDSYTTARYDHVCSYGDTSNNNGASCSGWLLKHGNMDYLRKPIPED